MKQQALPRVPQWMRIAYFLGTALTAVPMAFGLAWLMGTLGQSTRSSNPAEAGIADAYGVMFMTPMIYLAIVTSAWLAYWPLRQVPNAFRVIVNILLYGWLLHFALVLVLAIFSFAWTLFWKAV